MKQNNFGLTTSMKRGKISVSTLMMIAVSNLLSFFVGVLLTIHIGMHYYPSSTTAEKVAPQLRSLQKEIERLPEVRCDETPKAENLDGSKEPLFPHETAHFATGMARTKKEDFANHFDLGVPLDLPKEGEEDVLILYQSKKTMPNKIKNSNSIDLIGTHEAVAHCDYLNIVLSNHDPKRDQCIAIVPQYESYHIQKWMKVKQEGRRALDHSAPLAPVSRGHQENGREQFEPPLPKHTRQNWDMLRTYLAAIDDVLEELKPIVEKITVKNTVIVMVCNFGQSELLVNFACSARARGLDISNVLVFATDEETKQLAESVGLTAYFDKRNFGDIPMGAAGRYGDKNFVAMMMAKVICVQVVGLLGVDILFQDVDIVWYRNPLEFFHDKDSPIYEFDAYFQDDGAHSVRYAPWSSNSGFYYLRNNDKTQYFLNSLLMSGDLVLKTDSHQQALVAVMSEHASLYGLRVKVLSRDEDEFPGGYHYHQKSGKYMRAMFAGEKKPYIFHMSWTKNKDNKLLFFKQLGQWYVNDQCVAKKPDEIQLQNNDFVSTCCAAEPLFSCHYRDKPSLKPCKDSPPIDEGKASFW